MERYKILIVDDEQGIVTMLKDYFQFHGYLVNTAMSGTEALKEINSKPDIILLDINMPGMDGLEVCRTIRDHVACPIIFLTARIEEVDAIIGFQSGGDDYVVKPFKLGELGARVEAHLRRESRGDSGLSAKFFDNLTINFNKRQVSYQDKVIPFTKKEFDIIELLTRNPGQVFDKERIYEVIWGYDSEGNSSIIVEERRKLNAAFAHDLRTPLTVLQGYTDFLEEYILFPEKEDVKLMETNHMMAYYIKRLADYVEVMNTIPKLEDTPVKIQTVPIDSFINMLDDNIKLTAKEYGKDISVTNEAERKTRRCQSSMMPCIWMQAISWMRQNFLSWCRWR